MKKIYLQVYFVVLFGTLLAITACHKNNDSAVPVNKYDCTPKTTCTWTAGGLSYTSTQVCREHIKIHNFSAAEKHPDNSGKDDCFVGVANLPDSIGTYTIGSVYDTLSLSVSFVLGARAYGTNGDQPNGTVNRTGPNSFTITNCKLYDPTGSTVLNGQFTY